MSHRHMTFAQLLECSGVRRHDARVFLHMLEARKLVVERDVPDVESLFGSLRPLGGWLRKALASNVDR